MRERYGSAAEWPMREIDKTRGKYNGLAAAAVGKEMFTLVPETKGRIARNMARRPRLRTVLKSTFSSWGGV